MVQEMLTSYKNVLLLRASTALLESLIGNRICLFSACTSLNLLLSFTFQNLHFQSFRGQIELNFTLENTKSQLSWRSFACLNHIGTANVGCLIASASKGL